jgi:hypothetical protein
VKAEKKQKKPKADDDDSDDDKPLGARAGSKRKQEQKVQMRAISRRCWGCVRKMDGPPLSSQSTDPVPE